MKIKIILSLLIGLLLTTVLVNAVSTRSGIKLNVAEKASDKISAYRSFIESKIAGGREAERKIDLQKKLAKRTKGIKEYSKLAETNRIKRLSGIAKETTKNNYNNYVSDIKVSAFSTFRNVGRYRNLAEAGADKERIVTNSDNSIAYRKYSLLNRLKR